jgi:ABC-type transport system substrate-binding protein
VPNLASSWEIDPADNTRWLFRIRPGGKFHDGSPFTAQAAQWNFEKILDNQSPQFDPRQSAQGGARIPTLVKATALSDEVLEVRTRVMQPIPMNEAIQQGLREAGIAVTFEVVEWNALQAAWRAGSRDPASRGAAAHNNAYFSQDPFTALIRHLDSSLVTPRGTNWGWYQQPEMDAIFERIRTGFGEGEIDRAAAEAHAKIVDDALFLFVAHDLNARAMHPRVRGFVQARNWLQDLGPVSIG